MKNLEVSLLVVLLTFLVLQVARAEMTYRNFEGRIVHIANRDGNLGTGVIVKDGYVLTVAHNYAKKGVFISSEALSGDVWKHMKKYQKQGKLLPAVVVKRDEDVDLMLLHDPRVKGSTEFADAELDEEVRVIGYSMGSRHVHRGYVSRISEKYGYLDTNATFGSSGAGVWNKKGQLIGIYDFLEPDRLGLKVQVGFVKASTIKEFLDEK